MRTRRLPFGVIGAVLLVGLVGVLAALQYRWLGQVSQAEREQLRRSLDSRAREFADEFDGQIGTVYLSLQLSREALDAGDWSAFAARVDQWRASARYPQLVHALYLAEAVGDRKTLRPYDAAGRCFGPAVDAWPPHLAPLRDQIAALPPLAPPTPAGAARFITLSLLSVAPEIPALLVPVSRHTATVSGSVSSFTLERPNAFVVAELDGEYIRRTLVPALVASYFPAQDVDSYRVAVLSGKDAVVFSRGLPPSAAVDPAHADLVTPFFALRLDLARGPMPFDVGAIGPPADRLAVVVQHREATVTSHATAGPAAAQVRLARHGWRLVLAHATGSLDAAVERARRRNLWLSFGILGVLGAGVVMVVVTGRRAANLAAQQMDFVATVSHELRTPLAVIRSAAQNLSAGVVPEPERARRYGELIEEEGRRLTEMVEQVLEYARLTGGPPASPRQPLDVAELAHAVAESCRPLCQERGVVLELSAEGPATGLRRRGGPAPGAAQPDHECPHARRRGRLGWRDGGPGCRAKASGSPRRPRSRARHRWGGFRARVRAVLQRAAGDRRTGARQRPRPEPRQAGGGSARRENRGGVAPRTGSRLHGVPAGSRGGGPAVTTVAPPPRAKRILLVEDEPGLVLTLSDRLWAEGYEVAAATDGPNGLARASNERWDLILLDVMLPGQNGFEVCRELRRRGIETPILMLTARGQVIDKVLGLKLGADDYLTKPFDMMELVARVEVQLRRSAPAGHSGSDLRFADVVIDTRRAEVRRGGVVLELSAREFLLLKYFVEHRGEILSREQLLNEVWGYHAMPSTRTVDVHVAWLRQKIEPNTRHPQYILTVHGLGYRFLEQG